MDKFNNKTYFVGIDISKDHLDVSVLRKETVKKFEDKKVANTVEGYEKMVEWLEQKKIPLDDCLFCMEHTGVYGLVLFAWLSCMQADFVVEPGLRIKKSIGMVRGKNDTIDARRIAEYAYIHRSKLEPFCMPATVLLQIKELLTYRTFLVKTKISLKNTLKSHEKYQPICQLNFIIEDIKRQIAEYEDRIANMEKQIKELIFSNEEIARNFKLACSVKGIGLVIASFMIVTTNNFTSFQQARKYACYCGIAPFEHSSGSSIKSRTRVSHLANKRIKALLANAASIASCHDPELRAYYHRKLMEGKTKLQVLNAISNKLVSRVFAVVNRQTPYVNIYTYNFA
jgi:transposase